MSWPWICRPARSCRRPPIEQWEHGYTITSAPLYYDGMIYSGISGGEFGIRGRLTAAEKFAWDTGDIGPGESKTLTFAEPGTYYYICKPHPWMHGQVIVER
jgi:plastocyanin